MSNSSSQGSQNEKKFIIEEQSEDILASYSYKNYPTGVRNPEGWKAIGKHSSQRIVLRPVIEYQDEIINRQISETNREETFQVELTETKIFINETKEKEEEFEGHLKLSAEVREALEKIQRFDRFIYQQEAERLCKDIIFKELVRIEKIKNKNKAMRSKIFDNELTITVLYNLLKLFNEVNGECEEAQLALERRKTEEVESPTMKRDKQQRSAVGKTSVEIKKGSQKKQDKFKNEKFALMEKQMTTLKQKLQSYMDFETFLQKMVQKLESKNSIQKELNAAKRKSSKNKAYSLLEQFKEKLLLNEQIHEKRKNFSNSKNNESGQLKQIKKLKEELSEEKKNKLKYNEELGNVRNIVQLIEEEGEWWKRIPEKTNINQFKAIYDLLALLKEKQEKLKERQGNSHYKRKYEQVKAQNQKIKEVNRHLRKTQKDLVEEIQGIKEKIDFEENDEMTDLQKRLSDYKILNNQIDKLNKQLKQENKKLKNINENLRKTIQNYEKDINSTIKRKQIQSGLIELKNMIVIEKEGIQPFQKVQVCQGICYEGKQWILKEELVNERRKTRYLEKEVEEMKRLFSSNRHWEDKFNQLELTFRDYRISDKQARNIQRRFLRDAKDELISVKQQKQILAEKQEILKGEIDRLRQKIEELSMELLNERRNYQQMMEKFSKFDFEKNQFQQRKRQLNEETRKFKSQLDRQKKMGEKQAQNRQNLMLKLKIQELENIIKGKFKKNQQSTQKENRENLELKNQIINLKAEILNYNNEIIRKDRELEKIQQGKEIELKNLQMEITQYLELLQEKEDEFRNYYVKLQNKILYQQEEVKKKDEEIHQLLQKIQELNQINEENLQTKEKYNKLKQQISLNLAYYKEESQKIYEEKEDEEKQNELRDLFGQFKNTFERQTELINEKDIELRKKQERQRKSNKEIQNLKNQLSEERERTERKKKQIQQMKKKLNQGNKQEKLIRVNKKIDIVQRENSKEENESKTSLQGKVNENLMKRNELLKQEIEQLKNLFEKEIRKIKYESLKQIEKLSKQENQKIEEINRLRNENREVCAQRLRMQAELKSQIQVLKEKINEKDSKLLELYLLKSFYNFIKESNKQTLQTIDVSMEEQVQGAILDEENKSIEKKKSQQKQVKKVKKLLELKDKMADEGKQKNEQLMNQVKKLRQQSENNVQRQKTAKEYQFVRRQNALLKENIDKLVNTIDQREEQIKDLNDKITKMKLSEQEISFSEKNQELRENEENNQNLKAKNEENLKLHDQIMEWKKKEKVWHFQRQNLEKQINILKFDIQNIEYKKNSSELQLKEEKSKLTEDAKKIQHEYEAQLQTYSEIIKRREYQIQELQQINKQYLQDLQILKQRLTKSFDLNKDQAKKVRPEMYSPRFESGESETDNSYDEVELQVLRRINQEVAGLVESNRQYQLKIALLESHSHKMGGNCSHIVDYFMSLQDKMEKLMTFLVEKEFLNNRQQYAKFTVIANSQLMKNDEEYMKNWLELMKCLFVEVNEKQKRILHLRTSELGQLQERIKEIVTNRKQPMPVNAEELEKHHMIITDLRYLLREYLQTLNPESLEMMSQCLGLQQV